jgi:tRNA(His) guanylyltransferase
MGKNQELKDALGERMKSYEDVNRTYLTAGIPKLLRLDGKAFHTLLRGAEKPYDISVMDSMVKAAAAVMKEIGGSARFAYIQSDECSIAINDKMTIDSEPWFGNNVQKMVSISSAIMSVNFTQAFNDPNTKHRFAIPTAQVDAVALMRPAYFDARIFQVPNVVEMHNAVLWRQFDASKNSISQYARSYFSHKELQNKNGSEMQDMMMLQKNFNWNNAPTWTKRGVLVYRIDRSRKDDIVSTCKNLEIINGNIAVDWEIPKFSEEPSFLVNLFNKPDDKEDSHVGNQ